MTIEKELKEMQKKINNLAYKTFKDAEGFSDFSVPHVPRISSQYLKNRFVFMGQETNTWYPDKGKFDSFTNCNPNELETILQKERYDVFCKSSANIYSSPLWEFSRKIYNEGIIEEPMINEHYLSHCWMNLFMIEKCKNKDTKSTKGRPSQNRELGYEVLANAQHSLVFEILKIIKPKYILATIGFNNDDYFCEFALGITEKKDIETHPVDSSNIITENMMREITIKDSTHPLYNTKIIQTFHPGYFLGKIQFGGILKKANHTKEKETLKKIFPNLTISQYYEQTLLKKLRELFDKQV